MSADKDMNSVISNAAICSCSYGYVAKVDGKNGITLPRNPLLDGAGL